MSELSTIGSAKKAEANDFVSQKQRLYKLKNNSIAVAAFKNAMKRYGDEMNQAYHPEMDRSLKFRSISEKRMASSITQTQDIQSLDSEKIPNVINIADGPSSHLNDTAEQNLRTVSRMTGMSPVGFDAHRLIDDSIFIQTADEVERQEMASCYQS